jgi:hypothetical protein
MSQKTKDEILHGHNNDGIDRRGAGIKLAQTAQNRQAHEAVDDLLGRYPRRDQFFFRVSSKVLFA